MRQGIEHNNKNPPNHMYQNCQACDDIHGLTEARQPGRRKPKGKGEDVATGRKERYVDKEEGKENAH